MATAADYLVLSTTQIVTDYKLRTRAVQTATFSAINASVDQILTAIITDAPVGITVNPSQVVLQPKESSTFTITYDTNYLETLGAGNILNTLNFIVTATPVPIPPVPPAPTPVPIAPTPAPTPGPTPTVSTITVSIVPNPSTFTLLNQTRQFLATLTVDDTIIPATFVWSLYDNNGFSIDSTSGNVTTNANGQYATTIVATVNTPIEYKGRSASASITANIYSGATRILGCTNPNSFNYNPYATDDDGSCIVKVVGCMDQGAKNYNPSANVNSGCIFPIYGCTDPKASNYNINATERYTENGGDTCYYVIVDQVIGCRDLTALNYNPYATVDGPCISKVYGCMDSNASNYNSSANVDNGSCIYPVRGCMNKTALNYNSSATIDDGSCLFNVYGCMDPRATNYNPSATSNDGVTCTYLVYGCMDPTALNYNAFATSNEGIQCSYPNITVSGGGGSTTSGGGGGTDQTMLSDSGTIGTMGGSDQTVFAQ